MEDILKNPDKLRDLDLDAFAEELERQDYGNKRTTLYDIRNELFEPFKERRSKYTAMSQVMDSPRTQSLPCGKGCGQSSHNSWALQRNFHVPIMMLDLSSCDSIQLKLDS